MVKSIPKILLSAVLIQDNLYTFQFVQNTLCISLPHKGSLADRETNAVMDIAGKIQADVDNKITVLKDKSFFFLFYAYLTFCCLLAISVGCFALNG